MKNNEVMIPFLGDLGTDQRCYRMAVSLKEKGLIPIVLCDKPKTDLGVEWQGIDVRVISPYSHRNNFKLAFLFFLIRLKFILLTTKSKLWIIEDCPPLLMASVIGKFKKAVVVYDSRELFANTPDVINRGSRRLFWSLWESIGSKFVNSIITVSPLMLEYIKNKTGKKVFLILNSPMANESIIPKNNLGKTIKLLYQGELRIGSGIISLIESIKDIREYSLIVFGSGVEDASIRNIVKESKIENRVDLKGRVSLGELNRENKNCDIGIHLLENNSTSFNLTLSNKIFEYLHLGIPILLGNTEAHKRLLNEYKIGEIAENLDKEEINKKLKLLVDNYSLYKDAIIKCRETLTWENGFNDFFKSTPKI